MKGTFCVNTTELDDSQIENLISLHEASEIFGFSQGHLALLIRRHELKGWKIGRNWVTTREAVVSYISQNRKPGPRSNSLK